MENHLREVTTAMIKTVIFELDCTLLNTLQELANAATWVCGVNNWPTHPTVAYKTMVGDGIPKLVERFAPPWARTEAMLGGALAQFSARYAAHKMDTTAPYPGMKAVLKALQAGGVRLAVFSNKSDGLCKLIIRHYFGDSFALVRGSLPGVPTKPDPTGLQQLMKQLGATPETTLFVGDSDVDIHTAHNAGLMAVGACWGFRGAEELKAAGADALADSPAGLLALLQTINANSRD